MPEGPEVAIKAEGIEAFLNRVGRRLVSLEQNLYETNKRKLNTASLFLPIIIEKVYSRGKQIILEGYDRKKLKIFIVIHLGMVGDLLFEVKGKHSHLKFVFENNEKVENNEKTRSTMFFDDARKFGSVHFYNKAEMKKNLAGPCLLTAARQHYENLSLVSTFQEPSSLKIWEEGLQKRIKRSRTEIYIGEFLLEQDTISGIGNYLRAEILYECRISPKRPLKKLTKKEISTLYSKSLEVIFAAWLCKGPGKSYICGGCFPLKVYKKKECGGNKVETYLDKQKRTVHYVPAIQK